MRARGPGDGASVRPAPTRGGRRRSSLLTREAWLSDRPFVVPDRPWWGRLLRVYHHHTGTAPDLVGEESSCHVVAPHRGSAVRGALMTPPVSSPPRSPDFTADDFPGEPELQCDIVMKGGITSGVVYPLAVCELATTYRLRSVGGASAGAIAAAAAVAAEMGRRSVLTRPAGPAAPGHRRCSPQRSALLHPHPRLPPMPCRVASSAWPSSRDCSPRTSPTVARCCSTCSARSPRPSGCSDCCRPCWSRRPSCRTCRRGYGCSGPRWPSSRTRPRRRRSDRCSASCWA